jgi:hypothetical protein
MVAIVRPWKALRGDQRVLVRIALGMVMAAAVLIEHSTAFGAGW